MRPGAGRLQGDCTMIESFPDSFATATMGTRWPPISTSRTPKLKECGPKPRELGLTTPLTPTEMLVPVRVVNAQGAMPGKLRAVVMMPEGERTGPKGTTVSVKAWESEPTEARIVTLPGLAPAVTAIVARPFESVWTDVVPRAARPL